jgi:hypothetical protein
MMPCPGEFDGRRAGGPRVSGSIRAEPSNGAPGWGRGGAEPEGQQARNEDDGAQSRDRIGTAVRGPVR